MELVSPKSRHVGNTILSCAFALGQIYIGVIAWASPTWRIFLRILYVPGLLYVSLWWLVPESVRWLLSRGRLDEAKNILKTVAEKNNKQMCYQSIERIIRPNQGNGEEDVFLSKGEADGKNNEGIFKSETLIDSLRSVTLVLRMLQCSYLWICCTFVYYGLTIHSVSLSDNIYQSFIYAVAIEIPAYITCYFIMEKVGRKSIICSSLIIGGAACVGLGFVPEEMAVIRTLLFLVGKFCLTIAYMVVYVYTTEMFPTSSRHSMFALCSMFGRLGSMIAPQVPLLARVSKTLPMTMFGIMAVSSGLMVLSFPETLNNKLPDTVDDAVAIGKKPSRCDRTEDSA